MTTTNIICQQACGADGTEKLDVVFRRVPVCECGFVNVRSTTFGCIPKKQASKLCELSVHNTLTNTTNMIGEPARSAEKLDLCLSKNSRLEMLICRSTTFCCITQEQVSSQFVKYICTIPGRHFFISIGHINCWLLHKGCCYRFGHVLV
jgi:hypothetical protein